jgi:hypothetical protein
MFEQQVWCPKRRVCEIERQSGKLPSLSTFLLRRLCLCLLDLFIVTKITVRVEEEANGSTNRWLIQWTTVRSLQLQSEGDCNQLIEELTRTGLNLLWKKKKVRQSWNRLDQSTSFVCFTSFFTPVVWQFYLHDFGTNWAIILRRIQVWFLDGIIVWSIFTSYLVADY